jgi:hypothetical protein
MSINTRLLIVLGLIFLVAGCIAIFFINWRMKSYALQEAEAKARIILDSNLAVHTYFTHQLKPTLFEAVPWQEAEPPFQPEWMSSTYAVREIHNYFDSLHQEDYYYKEAAINARHQGNEADSFERDFIKRLNQNPELQIRSKVRSFEGQPFLAVLRRGETMQESCLRCHTEPESAPSGLVQSYGPERSFQRDLGDVVSAISIRIPLQQAYKNANRLSLQLASFLGFVLVGLFCAIVLLNRRWIFMPLERIRHKAEAISKDPKHLGEQIPPPQGRELALLVQSFNHMSKQLLQERDNLQQNVQVRTQELQEAIAEKDKFFSIIAHDLRSPISGFLSLSKLLAEDPQSFSPKEQERAFQDMKSSAQNLYGLLENLLQWARMQRGLIPFEPGAYTLSKEIDQAIELIRSEAEQKMVYLKNNVPTGILVHADPRMLQSLLQNLLSNALKFSNPEGSVQIDAKQQEEMIRIEVRDWGLGMDQDTLSNLFSLEGSRSNQGTAGEKGSGLGLVLCKEFIQRHGGELWARSEPGQGTAIYFTLPKG